MARYLSREPSTVVRTGLVVTYDDYHQSKDDLGIVESPAIYSSVPRPCERSTAQHSTAHSLTVSEDARPQDLSDST